MFNAADYYKGMEQAGFSKDQIHALLKYQIDYMNEQFATKSDFRELRSDFRELRTELKAETKDLKNTMIFKLGGIVVSCTVVLGVILKLT